MKTLSILFLTLPSWPVQSSRSPSLYSSAPLQASRALNHTPFVSTISEYRNYPRPCTAQCGLLYVEMRSGNCENVTSVPALESVELRWGRRSVDISLARYRWGDPLEWRLGKQPASSVGIACVLSPLYPLWFLHIGCAILLLVTCQFPASSKSVPATPRFSLSPPHVLPYFVRARTHSRRATCSKQDLVSNSSSPTSPNHILGAGGVVPAPKSHTGVVGGTGTGKVSNKICRRRHSRRTLRNLLLTLVCTATRIPMHTPKQHF